MKFFLFQIFLFYFQTHSNVSNSEKYKLSLLANTLSGAKSGSDANEKELHRTKSLEILWPRCVDQLIVQGIEEEWKTSIIISKIKKVLKLNHHTLHAHNKSKNTKRKENKKMDNKKMNNKTNEPNQPERLVTQTTSSIQTECVTENSEGEKKETTTNESDIKMDRLFESMKVYDDDVAYSTDLEMYATAIRIRDRIVWLKWLNNEILAVLPLADFDSSDRFVNLISISRDVILHRTKRLFLQSHFKKRRRARERSGLVLHLNRFLPNTNLFQQAFGQLTRYGGEWINFKKPWKVVFDGEGGSDAGGPGRESVTAIMESIFTEQHHLFVPTPNDADATSSGTNDHVLREDRWLASPKQQNKHKTEFELVGKLLGMSFREQWSVPVRLARSIWRSILGMNKTIEDIREEDYSQYYLLKELKRLAPEDIESMGLDFTIRLSDNRIKTLKKDGYHIAVTSKNVDEYLTLATKRRLEEAKTAIQNIVRGFACVVPLSVVRSLYTWDQLENEVCGVSELNVERLKAHTSWPSELDSEIEVMFWDVLKSFDSIQSANFLRFCWGRTRLPQDPDKIFMMRVKQLVARGSNSIDDLLPNAHTCDFSLLLPAYSSYSIMRCKLLRAISEQGFDLDGGATGTILHHVEEEEDDEADSGEDSDTDDEEDDA